MGRSRSQGTANSNAIQIFGDRKDPEELLWTAVLAKAIDDAIYTSDYDEALSAINRIEGEGRDFRFVCGLIGRDPKYIVRKVLTKILERKALWGVAQIRDVPGFDAAGASWRYYYTAGARDHYFQVSWAS